MKSPEQELFQTLRKKLIETMDCKVFDTLPPESEDYPFLMIEGVDMVDDFSHKGIILATVAQRIHVWDRVTKRGSVSEKLNVCKRLSREVTSTGTYSWTITGTTQQILADDTTGERLLHGVIDLDYQLLGGK